MRVFFHLMLTILFFIPVAYSTTCRVAVLWEKAPGKGRVQVVNGCLHEMKVNGKPVCGDAFDFMADSSARLEISVADTHLAPGAFPGMVTIWSATNPFTFILRDISCSHPVYIPEYGVVVTKASDLRDFAGIAEALRACGLQSNFDRYRNEPEESYSAACERNLDQYCPTWVGLGRDMRVFRVGYQERFNYWGLIEPYYHAKRQSIPETKNRSYNLRFVIGQGTSCRKNITRRLDMGVLPILHSLQKEDDVEYSVTVFATLENSPLGPGRVRGSKWQAVYPNTGGNMLSRRERESIKTLIEEEMHGREEEVVCCVRIIAANVGRVPRYAWCKAPYLSPAPIGRRYDGERGFSTMKSGRVYSVNRLNESPMPQEEMAILLAPGDSAIFDMLIPHQPLPMKRAEKLGRLDYGKHLAACRDYWRAKLKGAAHIYVPEVAINERLRAGLLHCDIAAYGEEPSGNVLATIGTYSPIGSESSPIIQFFDTMGCHKLAERSLQFFLDRQREDGFIQNFANYQLETGPVLWTMGEHYRYTRDDEWVRRVKPNIMKACDYLLQWRERNKTEENRKRGYYGLQSGKVADPNDFFHSFFLNAVSWMGLQRACEMLAVVDKEESEKLACEVEAYKNDIRLSYYNTMARAPVIPTGDGSWSPLTPPWAEHQGGTTLFADGGNWFSHGNFASRSALAGPLYLVLAGILKPEEIATTFMLKSNQQPFTVENAALSQPYYSRHDYAHLMRGETEAFLKTYYNQLTGLQDRETYTFWEHYYHISQHKIHEEAWFLLQTRWMLCMERGDSLALLEGIPRRWLENGKRIEVENLKTYFGSLSFKVESKLSEGLLKATVKCMDERCPGQVSLRLPHPGKCTAISVLGGTYDPVTEKVLINDFTGKAEIELRFNAS
jgi:hypothetical protein